MAPKKLQGQVAIVTGASRGIGRAAAERIALAGASVIMVARDDVQIEAAASALSTKGCEAVGIAADVADPEQIEAIIEVALERYRRIDILVNNAAVVWPLEETAEVDLDEWAYNIHVNLIGPFYLARSVLPVMMAQGYGRILNIGSAAAKQPIAGASAYCAAKAGLDMLTETLALELRDEPIVVAGFDPGGVDTDMQADVRSIDTDAGILDFSAFHIAKAEGRLQPPSEIARLILWLVGPWNRERGRFFRATDTTWTEQVVHDIPAD